MSSTREAEEVFYHYDFNGNIVQISSSNQVPLASYTYSPFGEVLLKEGLFDSRYQFSTKEYDEPTAMNYYGYRFYNPELGRWINRDPLGDEAFLHAKMKGKPRLKQNELRKTSRGPLYVVAKNAPILHGDYLGLRITNDGPCPVIVKPEDGGFGNENNPPEILYPGQKYFGEHDGFMSCCNPDCKVFKTGNGINVDISEESIETSGGNLIAKAHQACFGGCKDENFTRDGAWGNQAQIDSLCAKAKSNE